MADNDRYDKIAVTLHWVVAVLVLGMLAQGFYMTDLPTDAENRSFFYRLHKSMGLTVLLLMVARLAWRLRHSPPAWPPSMPAMQQRLARLVHGCFYVFLLLQPLSGYLSSSFSGYPTRFWGIPLPQWGWKEPVWNENLTTVHEVFAIVLVTLIVTHIAATLVHVFAPGQKNVLWRILPLR